MTDEAVQRLVELVQQHYAQSSDPLLLSRLGIDARNEGIIEGPRGSGALTALIKQAGEDRLRAVVSDIDRGRTAIALPSNALEVERRLAAEHGSNAEAERFSALPRPLQVAFCVRTEPGETVYVQPSPPFHYEKVKPGTSPSPGYVHIDDRFRLPGLRLQDANDAKKAVLWQQFQTWAEAMNLPLDRFSVLKRRSAGPHGSAFSRLLEAQAPEIRSRIVFPADIVELLLRHS